MYDTGREWAVAKCIFRGPDGEGGYWESQISEAFPKAATKTQIKNQIKQRYLDEKNKALAPPEPEQGVVTRIKELNESDITK
jgi:hypothetical protein